MDNPFKNEGLVWANGKGMYLIDNMLIPLAYKPNLTFQFDSLYCEATLCRKVVEDADYPLTEDEIQEVQDYITTEKTNPMSVDGVDADGKYLRQVSLGEVKRVVRASPPNESQTWRLDPNNFFELWVQVFPVDTDGYRLDTNPDAPYPDDGSAHYIVRTPLPVGNENNHVKKWKWDFVVNKWIDGELYVNKIKTLHSRKIMEQSERLYGSLKELTVAYKGTKYDADLDALNILTAAVGLGIETITWFPTDAITPVALSTADIKGLAQAIFDEQQKEFANFYVNKKAILKILDEETLINFTRIK